jgi:mono/diheme cytochrome c family protein
VLPLLAVAGMNALFLKPAIVRGIDEVYGQPAADEGPPPLAESEPRPVSGGALASADPGLDRLRWLLPRTTALEFVLAAAVLVATAVLTQTTPAEGEMAQERSGEQQPFSFAQDADDLSIRLTVAPFGIGVNTFTVDLEPAEGADAVGDVLAVRLEATPYDLETLSTPLGAASDILEMEPVDEDTYTLESAMYNQPAHWRTMVEVRRAGVDDTQSSFGVHLVDPSGGEKPDTFELPFDFVDWNVVAGGALLAVGLGLVLIWRSRPPSWQSSTSTSVGVFGGVLLLAGAVVIFGVDAHDDDFTDNPIDRTEESVAQGKSVYEMNCMVCHGQSGKGDGPNADSLPVRPADLTYHVPNHPDGTLFKVISLGVAGVERQNMPAFEQTLTEDERWHLINYLRSQFGDFTGGGDFAPAQPTDAPATDATPAAETPTGAPPTATPTSP